MHHNTTDKFIGKGVLHTAAGSLVQFGTLMVTTTGRGPAENASVAVVSTIVVCCSDGEQRRSMKPPIVRFLTWMNIHIKQMHAQHV